MNEPNKVHVFTDGNEVPDSSLVFICPSDVHSLPLSIVGKIKRLLLTEFFAKLSPSSSSTKLRLSYPYFCLIQPPPPPPTHPPTRESLSVSPIFTKLKPLAQWACRMLGKPSRKLASSLSWLNLPQLELSLVQLSPSLFFFFFSLVLIQLLFS
jgi:hypothetical protein